MQKIIHINSNDIIVIEFPNRQKRESYGIFCDDSEVKYEITQLCNKPFLNISYKIESLKKVGVIFNEPLPEKNEFELINKWSCLTELQAKSFLKQKDNNIYRSYLKDEYRAETYLQSFDSIMKENDCYLKTNPHRKPIFTDYAYNGDGGRAYSSVLAQWKEEDKKNNDWIILIIKK